MIESRGGDFHEGRYTSGFELIQEYFQQQLCRHCSRQYAPEGIELIREEPGIVVVRVGCSACGRPLGIALVGLSGKQKAAPRKAHPDDWSKGDVERLAPLPPISYDDVLDAHHFFSSLTDNWQQLLPARKRHKQRLQ